MDAPTTVSDFKRSFRARVKQARDDAGYTQQEIADILDIKQDKYSKYEVRSFMPHPLIPRFCSACKVSIGWLYTGRHETRRKVMASPHIYADN